MLLLRRTLTDSIYLLFVLALLAGLALSAVALLSQAIRNSPTQSWKNNFNVVIIGASYIVVGFLSFLIYLKRKFAVHQSLSRISKTYRLLGSNDLSKSVHAYTLEEYGRSCLVAYKSLPTAVSQEGWGSPGTKYEGVRFRRALLDTVPEIDKLAHLIIPSHPKLKPHARMIHHFRFLLPFLQDDEDGIPFLHLYDSAIQLARHSTREPTEREFELGMDAAEEIMRNLHEVLLGLAEDSTTRLDTPLDIL